MAVTKRSVKGSALTFAEMDANWDDAGAGGAWTLISNTTIDDDASVDLTLDNSTYSSYRVLLENIVPATDNTEMWLRFSTDGGSSFHASGYSFAGEGVENGAAHDNDGSSSIQSIEISEFRGGSNILGNSTNESWCGDLMIFNTVAVAQTRVICTHVAFTTAAGQSAAVTTGWYNGAEDTDAIQFLTSSGNLTSGQIKLIGLKI